MPPPIGALAAEMLKHPGDDQPAASGRAGRRHHAGGLSGAAGPEGDAARSSCSSAGMLREALVFTRTKHRANRLADHLRASQGQRRAHSRQPLAGAAHGGARAASRAGSIAVLVATDIAARGIDVEALSHVVNFDVPAVPDDYIHRVGRTGRAELTGDAFTFVAPEEEGDLRAIERAIGKDAAARHAARLRLQGQAPRQARDPARAAHRGDSRAEGGGAGARPRRTPSGAPGRRSRRRRPRVRAATTIGPEAAWARGPRRRRRRPPVIDPEESAWFAPFCCSPPRTSS